MNWAQVWTPDGICLGRAFSGTRTEPGADGDESRGSDESPGGDG